MSIADDLHMLFESRSEAFYTVDGQPTDAELHCIFEELAKPLYTIQLEKEGGKHYLIFLIMEKANYTDRFGTPLPRPNCQAIYDESISDGATGVIRAKDKATHRAHITDWDAFEAAEREAQSFIINTFDEAWYS